MTAEIAIMNREAVALAADSAVTISLGGAPRVYASANKLFALSRHQPIGVMIYGNSDFMTVPWETVIKLYRARLAGNAYSTVEEYASDFISFVQSEHALASEDNQEAYVRRTLSTYYGRLQQEIEVEFGALFRQKLQEEPMPTPQETSELFGDAAQAVIDRHHQLWRAAKYANTMGAANADSLRKQYRKTIRETKESALGAPLTATTSRKLTRLAGWVLSKYADLPFSLGETGVVIAGFGADQVFPAVQSLIISGISGGKLKYKHDKGKSDEISATSGATVIPYAQDEMVRSFMEGIEPDYWVDMLRAVRKLLDEFPSTFVNSIQWVTEQEKERFIQGAARASEDVFEVFNEEFNNIKRTRYVDPVVTTIASMPKSELPAVAEALVNLQSFKRRVSGEQETVGGPIDVMLISKGDGLVWIQRKHYFDRELNPHYFQSEGREVIDGNSGPGIEQTKETVR